jgi:predicted RNase H-like HicB family nuclease
VAENTGRRFSVNFIVVKDGRYYSALCLEYSTVGVGDTVSEALSEAAAATMEYLDHMIECRALGKAKRPAPDDLLLEYLDVEEPTKEAILGALRRMTTASGVLERKLEFYYDPTGSHCDYLPPSPLPFPDAKPGVISYPAELVLAHG